MYIIILCIFCTSGKPIQRIHCPHFLTILAVVNDKFTQTIWNELASIKKGGNKINFATFKMEHCDILIHAWNTLNKSQSEFIINSISSPKTLTNYWQKTMFTEMFKQNFQLINAHFTIIWFARIHNNPLNSLHLILIFLLTISPIFSVQQQLKWMYYLLRCWLLYHTISYSHQCYEMNFYATWEYAFLLIKWREEI